MKIKIKLLCTFHHNCLSNYYDFDKLLLEEKGILKAGRVEDIKGEDIGRALAKLMAWDLTTLYISSFWFYSNLFLEWNERVVLGVKKYQKYQHI